MKDVLNLPKSERNSALNQKEFTWALCTEVKKSSWLEWWWGWGVGVGNLKRLILLEGINCKDKCFKISLYSGLVGFYSTLT